MTEENTKNFLFEFLGEQPKDIKHLVYQMATKIKELNQKLEIQRQKFKNEINQLKVYKELILLTDVIRYSQRIKLLQILDKGEILPLGKLAKEIGWSETTQRKWLKTFNEEKIIMYNSGAVPIITKVGKLFLELYKHVQQMISNFYENHNINSLK